MTKISEAIISALSSDIVGRKGLGSEWEQMASDIKENLLNTWGELIDDVVIRKFNEVLL